MASQQKKPGAESKPAGGLVAVEAQLAKLERVVAGLDPKSALLELQAQLNRIESMLLELRSDVPRLAAQAPQALDVDEVAELLASDQQLRLICLSNHKPSGLRPGDAFSAHARFASKNDMLSMIRGGKLRVARAAA